MSSCESSLLSQGFWPCCFNSNICFNGSSAVYHWHSPLRQKFLIQLYALVSSQIYQYTQNPFLSFSETRKVYDQVWAVAYVHVSFPGQGSSIPFLKFTVLYFGGTGPVRKPTSWADTKLELPSSSFFLALSSRKISLRDPCSLFGLDSGLHSVMN